jgi:hypothetical protein
MGRKIYIPTIKVGRNSSVLHYNSLELTKESNFNTESITEHNDISLNSFQYLSKSLISQS